VRSPRELGHSVGAASRRYANSIAITGHRDHATHVTVDDDGPGIPALLREEVFKPFCGSTPHATRTKAAPARPRDRARHRALARGDIALGDSPIADCAHGAGAGVILCSSAALCRHGRLVPAIPIHQAPCSPYRDRRTWASEAMPSFGRLCRDEAEIVARACNSISIQFFKRPSIIAV